MAVGTERARRFHCLGLRLSHSQKLTSLRSMTAPPCQHVIEISVRWPDAKLALHSPCVCAGGHRDEYRAEAKPAKQYANWFNLRSRALRRRLVAKQKRLSDFQSSTVS